MTRRVSDPARILSTMDKKICPFCALDVPSGATTCANCGGAIPAVPVLPFKPSPQPAVQPSATPVPSVPFAASPVGTGVNPARRLGIIVVAMIALSALGVGVAVLMLGDVLVLGLG